MLQEKMAPTYKLTYFDIPALGEPMRLLMSYGKIDFDDKRVQLEEWCDVKPTTPMGQLPMLEYDGKVAHQSLAISRYFGKKLKLAGDNDWEALEIDIAADTIYDLRSKISVYYYEMDPKIKELKKSALFNEQIPFYVGKLEEQIKKNNGYLASGKLSWADFYFAGIIEYLSYMVKKDLTKNAPGMRKIYEKVCTLPNVKVYLEKRPKTDFHKILKYFD